MSEIERIIARYGLTDRDVLYIAIFSWRAREGAPSLIRGLFDYVRGVGPTAVAAGRVGVRCVPLAAVDEEAVA